MKTTAQRHIDETVADMDAWHLSDVQRAYHWRRVWLHNRHLLTRSEAKLAHFDRVQRWYLLAYSTLCFVSALVVVMTK